VNDAFSFVNFNSNKDGSASVDSPLTQIYANGNYASQGSAAGYEAGVDAGTHTYSWTIGSNERRIDAAAFFVVVPEPTTLLIWSLLAGLGVGLRWRRRK
jgi:hypothetical protein